MIRAVDILLEFLAAEQARGVSHIHLDESARDGLRELFQRTRSAGAEAIATPVTSPPIEEISASPAPVDLSAEIFMEGDSRVAQLAALQRQAENWPPARALGSLRETLVFGSGNPDARVMLIGEAPGYLEEKERQPFVGPSGQKLNDILKAMGLSREEVYISNVVKFRPAMARQSTNNRKPTREEMAVCLPFLRAEIAIVKPECIIALGDSVAEGLLGAQGGVATMRGPWYDFEGTPLRVTYHPSYLLQNENVANVKRQVWEDMLATMEKIGLPISEKQRGYFLPKA